MSTTIIPVPTCVFGTPIAEHDLGGLFACAECAAESERLRVAFQAAVRAGTYDAEGYTPAERRARLRAAEEGTTW